MKRSMIVRGVMAFLLMGVMIFSASVSVAQDKSTNTRIYELRTYTTLPGRLPALNKRFADHTMKLFDKHGHYCPVDR